MLAYCPGHITGFFKIADKDVNDLKKGSCGVGFCVEAGAYSEVWIKETDKSKIVMTVNGKKSLAPVTRKGIQAILPQGTWLVEANIRLDAPIGQGFGMSAAGTFASCLAIAEILNIRNPKRAALCATHVADVECNTGLGDAVAQSLGGVVYRLAPGVPPFGKLKKISHDEKDVVICILGNPIKTSNILNSARIRTGINNAGSKALLEFSKNGFFSDFTRLSWNFAIKSGLATKKMEKALSSISGVGEGSMVMLGNAVFAFGDSIELASRLKLFGSVFKTHITNKGPYICE